MQQEIFRLQSALEAQWRGAGGSAAHAGGGGWNPSFTQPNGWNPAGPMGHRQAPPTGSCVGLSSERSAGRDETASRLLGTAEGFFMERVSGQTHGKPHARAASERQLASLWLRVLGAKGNRAGLVAMVSQSYYQGEQLGDRRAELILDGKLGAAGAQENSIAALATGTYVPTMEGLLDGLEALVCATRKALPDLAMEVEAYRSGLKQRESIMCMKQFLGPLMADRCDRALAALFANAKIAQGWAAEYQIGMDLTDAAEAVAIYQLGTLVWDSTWNANETARMNLQIAFGGTNGSGARDGGGGNGGGGGAAKTNRAALS